MFTVYTKDNCPQCDIVKAMLTQKQLSFTALKIGADITLEAFKQEYPQVRALPYILSSGKPIGGPRELNALLAA